MQRLAAPMIGGTITAPVLSLFVLPAIYKLLGRKRLAPRNSDMIAPLSRDRIRTTCRPVTRRPAILVLFALALLLAPLGVCLSGSAAMAAPSHASGMHHASPPSTRHSDHGAPGKLHYCPECQPPSFVKAGKVAAPDVAPLSAGIAPAALVAPLALAPTKSVWARAPSPRPPPLRRTYRIRLQI